MLVHDTAPSDAASDASSGASSGADDDAWGRGGRPPVSVLERSLGELDVAVTTVFASTLSGDATRGRTPAATSTSHVTSALERLADAADETSDSPLLVGAADLEVGPVALLDVVDGPRDVTGAVTLEPGEVATDDGRAVLTPVRVSRTGRIESSASRVHSVSDPTAFGVGLVRVAAGDRPRAAALWRAAARQLPSDGVGDATTVDLALLALVRGGLPVAALPLGLYSVSRSGVPVATASGSGWEQRLRSSSRGDDGAFSKAVVRPVSRRLTAVGLRHDWRPNAVTAVSLSVGLAAAALVLVDSWWCFALAAVLLQLSLVVDCVDGEIARFTRSYSPLGAWLDGVSDRVKEFAVIATVTTVAVRHGHDLWWLAIALVTVLTIRQVEDYAYHARLRAGAARAGARMPLTDPGDGGAADRPHTVPRPVTGRARWTRTVKQVLHVPIAERYLIMSVGLLTGSPTLLLVVLAVAVAVALAWTHVGRTVRALRGRDGFDPARPDPALVGLTDLGPVAHRLADTVRAPVAAAWAAVALSAVAALAVGWGGSVASGGVGGSAGGTSTALAVVAVVVAGILLGPGCAAAARSRLGWLLPGAIAAGEGAVVLAVTAGLPPWQQWAGYAWIGAVAWHLYDTTYRIRSTGRGPAPWVARLTLGAEGRTLLVVAWWALGLHPVTLFVVGAPLLLVCWVAESRYSWRPTARRQRDSH
ncbi:CDP-alcohol phosphatidyltransferase-like enzyme [Terracoccus luteus]|uniref:CDP-alcohol phosphatidyltransferase-like enzyme n=1 Tax=Terracoccus luteus TaxID=53356 RepID=A0A495XRZ7_9MICO|nr:CDP-alcohol phosphatidyltransferase-like enzyme [Terracoccus luteus]